MRLKLTVVAWLLLGAAAAPGRQAPATAPAGTPQGPAVLSDSRQPTVLPAEKAQPVRITRFSKPPVIDGYVDDDAWREAAALKNFYQVEPGDNVEASRQTLVLMGYDAQRLYLYFHAYDEPSKVRATVAKRDAVSDDDHVRILLDTFDDRSRAYLLIFNPLGVQADAVFTEDKGEDYSVDLVMESRGRLTDDGYVVEAAVPFRSLRYRVGEGHAWGVNVQRRIKHLNNELDSWMPVSRDRAGTLNQLGRITGIENLSNERTLELIPSLTMSETGRRVRSLPMPALPGDPSRFVNQPMAFDPGLTLRYGITSTTSLHLAVNPDFAQVEADQLVVTANQRFPIFYQEKRPFFLEGIEIFQTPLNTVHTRTIIDPDVAFKLTGKSGRNTYGLIFASDAAPGNFSEEERADPFNAARIQRFVGKNASVGVLRLRRDIGTDSNVGLIATAYSFIDNHNYVGGADGRLRLDKQTVLSFQVLGTTSRQLFFDPDLGRSVYRTGNALGYYFSLNRTARHFGYTLSGQGFTRDYRANVGFTRRVNTNLQALTLQYKSEPKPKARLISWTAQSTSSIRFDFRGRLQVWDESPQLLLNFRRQTYLLLYGFFGRERLYEEEFGRRRNETQSGAFSGPSSERGADYRAAGFQFGTTPGKSYSVKIDTYYAPGIFDFDFGAGRRFPRVSPDALAFGPSAPLDPGPGRKWVANASVAYQPTGALRVTLDYTKTSLRRNDTGRYAFDDNIYSLRTTYQFTRFAFARARVDYDSLSLQARGQFLFGWTPNPGTSFYVGYNDAVNRNGFNPFTGQPEPGLRRNDRTFFIKTSYLFRRSF